MSSSKSPDSAKRAWHMKSYMNGTSRLPTTLLYLLICFITNLFLKACSVKFITTFPPGRYGSILLARNWICRSFPNGEAPVGWGFSEECSYAYYAIQIRAGAGVSFVHALVVYIGLKMNICFHMFSCMGLKLLLYHHPLYQWSMCFCSNPVSRKKPCAKS